MSDTALIVTAICTLLGGAFSAYMVYLTNKLNKIAEVSNKTHILVNANMGAQLKLTAELSRWKAISLQQTATTPVAEAAAADALAAALAAEDRLRQHEKQQAIVDAGKGP